MITNCVKNQTIMNKTFIFKICCVILLPLAIVACSEEDYGDVNSTKISKKDLDASFTIDLVSANNYTLTGNDDNVIFAEWNLSDGNGFTRASNPYDVFLPDQGTYTIQHVVHGAGGVSSDTISQTLVVSESDPESGNLVRGGTFETEADIAEWTIGGTNSGAATWTFANGKATLTGTGSAGNGIFQAIDVVAGKNYQIDMIASSTSGLVNSWFEVYCGYTEPGSPTQSSDYSEGGALLNINTWSGSGTEAFSGKLTQVGSTTDSQGVFTASSTGTVYLVLRGGGDNMQDGLSITNVTFRGISE
jgi:hypothetical protein